MAFQCGIVGLPNVGKSTLFNALTESNKAEVANYPFATIKPNVGRVLVQDERIEKLSKISSSEKTRFAYIDFVDIAGLIKGASIGEGLGNKFLSHIREVDAIAHVVRCFENKNITHVSPSINPIEDIETIETEIKLADITILENKLINLQKKVKSGDREMKINLELIKDLLEKMNKGQSLDSQEWSQKQQRMINDLNLITNKPTLYVCNVDEKSIVNGNHFSHRVQKRSKKEGNQSVLISAVIESQIAQFDNKNDKMEFFNDIGIKETTLKKMIHCGYRLLDLITFFTSESKETRAWTVKKNTTVTVAAGKIHSDIEKGFICAETISYADFVNFKGEDACRKAGKLRVEGKDYVVQDGDIFHFLFNV